MHKDDAAWVREQLFRIPAPYRVKACEAYSKVWQEAHDTEPLLHCKDNAGRFAANCRLRAFVKKVQSAMRR